MVTNIYKCKFIADDKYCWGIGKEQALRDEMQNIAEWAAVGSSDYQGFLDIVMRELKVLNSRHKSRQVEYIAYDFDGKGARIRVTDCHLTIGEFQLIRRN